MTKLPRLLFSRFTYAAFLPLLFFALVSAQPQSRETYLERARQLLQEVPLIDGHNDVPWQYLERVDNHLDRIDLAGATSRLRPPMHTDFSRLRQGLVGGQFWSVYVPVDLAGAEAVGAVLGQIDVVHRLLQKYPQQLELALTADDVERIHQSGKIASLIGMEGGHSIHNSVAVLRQMFALGARYMTLTHNDHTDWADSATRPPRHNGLTEFGREVLGEMNRLGMLVDLSHVSAKTMHDVLEVTEAPVLYSHSSAYGVVDYVRNVPDDVLRKVAANKGVVMVNFVRYFICQDVRQYHASLPARKLKLERLYPHHPAQVEEKFLKWQRENPPPPCRMEQVADHVDHIRQVAGVDTIGIGSDFDGLKVGPIGLEDVSDYPNLFAELLRRGYTDLEIRKIAGLNVLRVMRAVEDMAARLQRWQLPSDALIEELDSSEQ